MTGNRDKIANALREFGQAAYELADALLDQPATAAPEAGSAHPAPADDLPDLPSEPAAKSRDQVFAECPVHFKPWTVKEGGISKAGKPYKAFWKCNGTNSDGTYCNKKPDASWVRAHDPEQALLRGAA
jgi:hypothetical protein